MVRTCQLCALDASPLHHAPSPRSVLASQPSYADMLSAFVRQNLASLSCSLAVAMTGTAFAWFAPLMLRLTSAESPIPMSESELSWVVAAIEFGEVVAVIPAGIFADWWGRRTLVLSAGPMCALSYLLKAVTLNIPVLYVVRFVQGVALGIAYTVCPIYIAEIAEPRHRGFVSTHFQTLWYAGALFAYIAGPYVDYQTYAYICLSVPLLFMATFYLMPESPYYLLMKGRHDEAQQSLQWFRNSKDVDAEFKGIVETVERESMSKGSWRDLFATKKDRKAFLVVQIVCLTKYMNGVSAVITYSSKTFGEVTANLLDEDQLTIALGVLLTVTTLLSSGLSDSVGRRPLLLGSSLASAICLFILGSYYLAMPGGHWVWISYASLTGFCIAANVGLGPLMQTIQAEFFTSKTRGVGGGLTEVVASIGAFLCIKQYQVIQDWAGVYLNYYLYASVCLFGTIALYFCLPETAGRSLGQIQKDMEEVDEPPEKV